MNKISSKVWIETVLTAAVMIMAPIAFHNQDFFCFSWWFVAATEIMVAACMGMTWAWHLKVRNPDDSSCSMLEFAKSVKELKTKYQKWTSKCLMVIIPWGIWLVVEIFCHSENHAQALIFSAYCIVCGIIGFLVGLRMNKKVMAECDGIIRQIEE